jgi:hypothetical protein
MTATPSMIGWTVLLFAAGLLLVRLVYRYGAQRRTGGDGEGNGGNGGFFGNGDGGHGGGHVHHDGGNGGGHGGGSNGGGNGGGGNGGGGGD